MRSSVSKCGWALASHTRPWVAQRVWPMPVVGSLAIVATAPPSLARSLASTASRRNERLPTVRTESTWPSTSSESPAES